MTSMLKEFYMKCLVCVIQDISKTKQLLSRFNDVGIKGATLLTSKGMISTLSEDSDEWFVGSLRQLFEMTSKESATMFVVISQEQESLAFDTIESVIGSLNLPNTGIAFSFSIDKVRGIK
jgi:hypothetical protein